MNLEEMQAAYNHLSNRVEKQDILSTQLLESTIQQGYQSRLNRIGYSEMVGTLVCYAAAAYVSVHLTKIDGVTQMLAGLAIVLLLVLPIVSLASVRAIKSVNISAATYLETIQTFARQKVRFQRLQKLNMFLNLLLLLVAVPVLAAILEKDLSQVPHLWTVIVPVAGLVILAFAYWVLRAYNKILSDMESLLTDITN